jgi:hypothetical protein
MLSLASLASGDSVEDNGQIQSLGLKASRTTSEQSTINVQPSPVLQQKPSPPQSSKRRVEPHTGDLEIPGARRAKRFRGSPGSLNPLGGFLHHSQDGCSDATPREMGGFGTRNFTVSDHQRQDYQMQLMLLEQQERKRLMFAREEQDAIPDNGNRDGPDRTHPTQIQASTTSQETRINETSSTPRFKDYWTMQKELLLLEQENKKRFVAYQEQDALCDNGNRDGPDGTHPTQNQANEIYQNRIIDNRSTAGNSTIHHQHDEAQANISMDSQSPSVTAPVTVVSPMQQESTRLVQRTLPVVERDEAYDHTFSRPAPSPTALVRDTFGSPHHPNPLPPPASSQFGSKSQSPIQRPNQPISSFGSMQPAVYYRHEHPLVSQLEPLGNGAYRRSIYNPPPDQQRSLPQQQTISAPPFTQVLPGTESEPVDLTDYRPVPIPTFHPEKPLQQTQHAPTLITSVPPYSNIQWLEDSKFVCRFISALAAGHFLQHVDLISPVDHGIASAYLWCASDIDESWEDILGGKDSRLRSRQDLEQLLNRWRGGPKVYVQKLSRESPPSGIVPGTATQAVPMGVDPQAAVSPAQGWAINTQFAAAAERQQPAPILLVDLLKATHDKALERLQQLPVWFQNLRSTKDSLPQDEKVLQDHQEKLNKKQAEIDTLDAKFEDIMQMMPKAQEEQLQQLREETRITMLRAKEELDRVFEDCLKGVQEKKARIGTLEGGVRSLKSGIPVAIETLKALVAQLPNL